MPRLILIIEDERDLVHTLEYALAREGFATAVAATGAQGLEQLRGGPRPDLVLLDLMLPDMAGIQVCQEIRANTLTRDTPVIIVTAKAEVADLTNGFAAGADDYVTKPFSLRDLMSRIRAALERRGRGATREVD